MIYFAAVFTEFPDKNASAKNEKNMEITSLTNTLRNVFSFVLKFEQLVFMGKPYAENRLRSRFLGSHF